MLVLAKKTWNAVPVGTLGEPAQLLRITPPRSPRLDFYFGFFPYRGVGDANPSEPSMGISGRLIFRKSGVEKFQIKIGITIFKNPENSYSFNYVSGPGPQLDAQLLPCFIPFAAYGTAYENPAGTTNYQEDDGVAPIVNGAGTITHPQYGYRPPPPCGPDSLLLTANGPEAAILFPLRMKGDFDDVTLEGCIINDCDDTYSICVALAAKEAP